MNYPESPILGHTIPHNREAEEAVIGSVLLNPECFDELGLMASNFYIVRHQWIWEAFEHLRATNTPIDFLTVTSELQNRNKMDEVGGHAYLASLLNQTPTSMNAPAYAKLVKVEAANREYLQVGNLLAQGAFDGSVDVAAVIDRLIKVQSVEHGAVSLTESLRELDKQVVQRTAKPSRVWGIPTGLYDYDAITGGLHAQETSLLVGPPDVGKTTLLLQICIDAAIKEHRHVALYEMEMDTLRLLQRAIYMLSGPSPRKLKTGYFEDDDYTTYLNAMGQLDTPYLHICDNPMLTTTMMRADLARLRSKYNIELVGIDYLNLFADADGRDDNEKAKLRSRRFRAICREANVCGISIQGLNKAGIAKGTADIQDVSGPADSGYDADWIWALSKENDTIKMTQLKGRDAETKGLITLVRRGLRFVNAEKPRY
jgi:replicative DNA helicase